MKIKDFIEFVQQYHPETEILVEVEDENGDWVKKDISITENFKGEILIHEN